jgi:hypothetical protein
MKNIETQIFYNRVWMASKETLYIKKADLIYKLIPSQQSWINFVGHWVSWKQIIYTDPVSGEVDVLAELTDVVGSTVLKEFEKFYDNSRWED